MGFDERALRSFVAVAEAGSIGSAAVSLGLSQPTLSRIIRAFEHQSGALLFERRPTGVTLTPAGDALLPYARMLLYEMGQAAAAVRVVHGLQPGVLRVGVIPPAVDSIVMPAIARLLEDNAELEVQLLEENDDRLLVSLTTNVIDLVIGPRPSPREDIREIGECLVEATWSVFCGRDHPLAAVGTELMPSDVLPGRWVMSPLGTSPRTMFEDLLRRHRLPAPYSVIETLSPDVVIASVIETNVLGWLPESLYARDLASGLVTRLSIPRLTLSDRMFVYKRAKGMLSPDARRLVHSLALKARGP